MSAEFTANGDSSKISAALERDSSSVADDEADPAVTLIAKWGKERIRLEKLPSATTIGQVKGLLTEQTGVLPKRQKLVGLVVPGSKGSVSDDVMLSSVKTKKRPAQDGEVVHQFILMGTAEEQIFVDPHEKDDLPEVIDDFDLDFNAGSEEWVQHLAIHENLKQFTLHTNVHIMNEPRENKPLMVLDLDHTLLDFSSKTIQLDTSTHRVGDGSAALMKRPFMDEFLTAVYRDFDLVVWSQTSWRWLETKLTELGMLTHPGYRFCFVLDKTSMFSIKSMKRDGSSFKHQVKPLQIIWTKFPRWGVHNTIHLDDLSRNFALNLQSGLKVTGFYRKKSKGKSDAELFGLSRYCKELAKSGFSFESVNFAQWQDVVSGKLSLADTTTMKNEEKPSPS
jgi:ubiquitin-like domain-containing CTD phosphatase 1